MNGTIKTCAAVLSLVGGADLACAMPLTVPQVQTKTTVTKRYACKDDKSLAVTYINTKNGQSFALMTVDGKKLLFVNVLSGSGARYSAEQYVWWTKGPQGTLTSEMADPKVPPLLDDCQERG
jgi:membrane-bound inhibitor of C-type lysozyme